MSTYTSESTTTTEEPAPRDEQELRLADRGQAILLPEEWDALTPVYAYLRTLEEQAIPIECILVPDTMFGGVTTFDGYPLRRWTEEHCAVVVGRPT